MGGGTTVLFVSHSIDQIREMCNRVIWLEKGEVKMEGETKMVCDAYQNILIRLLMMEIRSIRHLMHLNSFQMFFYIR